MSELGNGQGGSFERVGVDKESGATRHHVQINLHASCIDQTPLCWELSSFLTKDD